MISHYSGWKSWFIYRFVTVFINDSVVFWISNFVNICIYFQYFQLFHIWKSILVFYFQINAPSKCAENLGALITGIKLSENSALPDDLNMFLIRKKVFFTTFYAYFQSIFIIYVHKCLPALCSGKGCPFNCIYKLYY